MAHRSPGHWWELPGGGGEPGETYVDTAIRELHEETGIVAVPAQVSRPTWRRTATFRYRRARRLQHELVVTARLDHRGAEPDVSGQLDYEREDYSSSRWWPVAEVIASRERFYPGRLPKIWRPTCAATTSTSRSSCGREAVVEVRGQTAPCVRWTG